eukprot:COSAG04_NODE_541_length_12866_cov_847.972351_11_plen_126_part_00
MAARRGVELYAAACRRMASDELWAGADDGRLPEVERLLTEGASPDAEKRRRAALVIAAMGGRLEVVKVLVRAGGEARGGRGQPRGGGGGRRALGDAGRQRGLAARTVVLNALAGCHLVDCLHAYA